MKSIYLFAMFGLFLIVTVFAAIYISQTIQFSGNIATIGLVAYNDPQLTQICTSITMSNVAEGSINTQTIYLKNTGNVPETLTMSISNWNPPLAGTVLALSWDKENTVLPVGQSTPAVLTLTVASDTGALADFGCTITLTGEG